MYQRGYSLLKTHLLKVKVKFLSRVGFMSVAIIKTSEQEEEYRQTVCAVTLPCQFCVPEIIKAM